MNFHGKDIKIFTGSSNVDVAQGIAGCLGLPLGKSDCNLCSRQRQSYGNAHND